MSKKPTIAEIEAAMDRAAGEALTLEKDGTYTLYEAGELARLRARAELVGDLAKFVAHWPDCTRRKFGQVIRPDSPPDTCSCGLRALLARVAETQSDSESQAAQPPTRSPAKPK